MDLKQKLLVYLGLPSKKSSKIEILHFIDKKIFACFDYFKLVYIFQFLY